MKEYLKMANYFHGQVSIDASGFISDDKYSRGSTDIAEDYYGPICHAINSHDELVEMNRELLDALNEVASSLSWLAHGECRAFVDGPILTSSEAINKARLAIKKAKGGAV